MEFSPLHASVVVSPPRGPCQDLVSPRNARLFLIVASLAAMLSGCQSYAPAPISAARNVASIEARSLNNPRLQEFIAAADASDARPSVSPASAFTSPWGLARLTLAALYYHPDIEIARAKFAGARAAVVTARQIPNPTLNLSGVFATAAVAGGIPAGAIPATVGPVVDFVIETAGKREYRTAEAQHLAQSLRCDLATAGWRVRGNTRAAFLDLWAAQQRLTLARHRQTLQQELVALLESRLARGEASSLDVARERINRAQAELSIREIERSIAAARAQLATAVGIPVRALESVALSPGVFDHPLPLPGGTIGKLRQFALTNRTDVQSSLAEYEAAQSALQLQVANQYPNVILGPGYNYDIGVNRFSLSPTTDLPIFNQNQGQIAQAAAHREQAAARFNALQAQVLGAIDAADADYRAATRSLATADALLADAEIRARKVSKSFAAGEIDRSTLVTAELERAIIAASRFDIVLAQRQALGAMEDSLQHSIFDADAAIAGPQSGACAEREPFASAASPVAQANPRQPAETRS